MQCLHYQIGPVDPEESAIAVPLTPHQDLDLSLAAHQLDLNAEIDSLGEAELRDTEFDVLVNRMVEKYTVGAPAIDESEITTDVCDANIVANARLYGEGAWIWNRPVSQPGTLVTFLVPFTGDRELFKRRLPRADCGRSAVQVMDNQLVFVYERAFDGPSFDSQSIQEEFERDRETVKQFLAATDRDLEPFNSSLRTSARERIERRWQKFRGERQLREELPYDMTAEKRMPRTSKPIKTTVHSAPQPPPSSQEPDTPQPSSDVPEFTHSPDYKTLIVDGQKLRLAPMAVKAIVFIYKEWMRTGKPDVDEETVLKNIPTQQDSLYKAVRHARPRIWNKMIRRGNTKGTVQLILSAFAKNA